MFIYVAKETTKYYKTQRARELINEFCISGNVGCLELATAMLLEAMT